jgi:uncharacterized protein
MENLKVTDNKEKNRFEIALEGGANGFIDYSEQNNVMAMTHTEIPPEFEGEGIGSRLVKGALEIVKNENKRVRPLCPFVAVYIERHPEYKALAV